MTLQQDKTNILHRSIKFLKCVLSVKLISLHLYKTHAIQQTGNLFVVNVVKVSVKLKKIKLLNYTLLFVVISSHTQLDLVMFI